MRAPRPGRGRASGRSRGARRPRRRWWRGLLGLGLGALVVLFVYEAWHWPSVATLARERPRTTAFIERYRQERRAAGADGRVLWTWVPEARISPHLKRAVLVAEDINFFSHAGFDLGELRLALQEAVEELEVPRGASTISQQLAKNLWLSPSRNPLRKAREALLTWQLERTLSKRRILELYLNVVEFGPGVYGAEAASQRYFARPAAELDEESAAQLAASLPSPASWHPGSTRPGYRRHVQTIRRRMARAEFLWRHLETGQTGRPADGAPERQVEQASPGRAAAGEPAGSPAAGTRAAGRPER